MKLIYKITIPVFLSLVLIILLIAFQMRAFLEKPLFQEEFSRKYESVLRAAPKYFSGDYFSDPFSPLSRARFAEFLEEIKDPSTARLTIWSRDRVIVFSDLKSVVGSRSPEQQDLARLFAGEEGFFVRKMRDTNQPLQSDVGEFLDIYIPIRISGAMVGAVEIHSVVAALLSPIERVVRYTTYILAGSSILILAVVFYLAAGLKKERDREAALALRNAELYEQSKKQAEDLERANKAKGEFLSVMSHELRTPLNVVMGYAAIIKDRMLGPINADQEKALAKVLSRAQHQLTMINGILMATQMESGTVKAAHQKLDLRDFLDDVRSNYEIPLDREIAVEWKYPVDLPVIETDPDKLRQILQNLVNNAIKFTERGSVTVSARCLNGEGRVVFKVADTGIGIPKQAQPLIFERFRQMDSSETRPYGGVGLGLYIVKNFTEALGGEITLESEPGTGSIFTVTLPFQT